MSNSLIGKRVKCESCGGTFLIGKAEKLDIQGTPTLFVNGRKYSGPIAYDEIKDWVDEELAR